MVKKILLVFFIFTIGYIYFNNVCFASSWEFRWKNDIVYIPAGQSIDKYKYKPQAFLYRDGNLLVDADINYNIEGDWLYYLTDVNTSLPGEYCVWYKAYDNIYLPGTCPGYKCLVKFIVYDDIPPTIEVLNDHIYLRRAQEYDLLSNIKVKDNCDESCEVSINHNIDNLSIGSYSVEVFAVDKSLNKSVASFIVEIFEDTPPTIIYKNEGRPINLSIDEQINLLDYFSAYDRVDEDITNKIKFSEIDYKKLGLQTCTASVSNSAGMTTEIQFEVCIIDNESPQIHLIDDTVVLDYTTDLSMLDFKNYILNITDNEQIDYSRLDIRHNIENKVGQYSVWFTYDDTVFKTTAILTVSMISYSKPIIETDKINYEIGNNNDIKEYIVVVDPSDNNIYNNLIIYDENVNYTKSGSYYLECYVINSSGLSASKRIQVDVINSHNLSLSQTNNNITIERILLIILSISLVGVITFFTILVKKKKIFKKID